MTTAALPPARLGRALKIGLRETWDRLGLVLAISLTWTLLLSLPLTVGRWLPVTLPILARLGIVLLTAVLVLSAPAAGAFSVAHLACARDEVSYADFWRGTARLFGPATRLGLIHLAVLSVFAVNLWFYLRLGNLPGLIAALVCLYAFLFWGMMSLYHLPLLAAQEAGVFDEPDRPARRGVRAALRRAFYLALGDPFFTLELLAVTLLVTVLLFATAALFAMLWLGTAALLTTAATRALLVRYGVLPPPVTEEPIPDEEFRIGQVK